MTPVAARRLARSVFALDLALLAAAGLLALDQPESLPVVVILLIAVLGWGGVGSLIAARAPRNPIGWLLLTAATAGAFMPFATFYMEWDMRHVAGLPLDALVGWASIVLVLPIGVATLPLLFLLYPDGALPSPRWRPVAWLMAATAVPLAIIGVVSGAPGQGLDPPAWAAGSAVFTAANVVAVALLVGGALAALVSLWLRLRRATPEDRGPLRWLAWLLTIMVGSAVLGLVVASFASEPWYGFVLPSLVIFPGVLFGIPFAFSIVLLRYGLYDYEVRMRKRIVATVLTAALTLVSLGIIALVSQGMGQGIRQGDGTATGLVIGAVAVTVAYLLVRVFRRFAQRVVFGERATAYEVLSEFSERIGETYGTEDVVPRMAQLLAANTGAKETRVWLRVGEDLRPVAGWPPDAAHHHDVPVRADGDDPSFPEGTSVFPVTHRGEQLGVLTLVPSSNDPMNPAKERLAQDLAAQAGLVLRNVALVEELRESRRRIVSAQDARARKLERDIHDGAQQQLVALAVQAKLARSLVDRDPAKAIPVLDQVQSSAQAALEDLRDLARGIYPPLLADQGLTAAVEAQARKAAVPVSVDAKGLGRYPADVEAAVYFCVLEALNNAAKYAGDVTVLVRLAAPDGVLRFEVVDEGPGFDRASGVGGTGLQGMADRLDALGGSLEVTSEPGHGTSVTGTVPVHTAG
jgi:signal transduction histidine kinase